MYNCYNGYKRTHTAFKKKNAYNVVEKHLSKYKGKKFLSTLVYCFTNIVMVLVTTNYPISMVF